MSEGQHIQDFLAAVNGVKGDLDAWLECNNEAECKIAIIGALMLKQEKCAQLADARAIRCEAKVAEAESDNEQTNLRSLAWHFSVLAAEIRKAPK